MARLLTRVLVQMSKLKHAMMVPVRLGPIGPAGMIAVPTVMEEFNPELANAKMGKKMIVQDHQMTSNNVIENHVKWFTLKTTGDCVIRGALGDIRSTPIIFPMVKLCSINVAHIVYRTTTALLSKLGAITTLMMDMNGYSAKYA